MSGFVSPAGPGVKKLSELQIDADRDWNGKSIWNLKELALGMAKGDIIQKGSGGVLIKITPGPISFELTSNGPGKQIEWKAPPTP